MSAADQRQGRGDACEFRESVEEIVFRPEHDRRPQDNRLGKGRQNTGFASGLALGIERRAAFIRADRRDLHHPLRAGRLGGIGDPARRIRLDDVEFLLARLVEDADEIDDGAGAGHRAFDRLPVADVGLNGMDLPHRPQRLQMAGQIGPAHGGAHAVAALGQRADHIAPDEARAAEDRDDVALDFSGAHPSTPQSLQVPLSYPTAFILYRLRIDARCGRSACLLD